MIMQPLISVIVPVYNVEQYLDRCVNSLVGQTYQNLEIILVDDGSPDGCSVICDNWARKDSRVIVIHKNNGGLSSARNSALDVCSGDVIAFVDSDDWVEPDMFEKMLESMQEHDADIVQCSVLKTYENGQSVLIDKGLPTRVFSGETALHDFLYHRNRMTSEVWNKIYKASLFRAGGNQLRFPEGLNSEDYYLLCHAYRQINKLYYSPQAFYHYCVREDSICREGMNPHTFDKIAVAKLCKDYLLSENYQDSHAIDFFVMQGHYDVLFTLLRNQADEGLLREYARRLRRACQPVYHDDAVSLSRKIRMWMFSHMPRVYYRMTKMMMDR